MIRFPLTPADAGTRLDLFLVGKFSISRARVQTLVKAGEITVNGKKVTPHLALKATDEVVSTADLDAKPKLPKLVLPPLDIIFEDKEILVVNKPAGLLVHPNSEHELKTRPTLTAMALKHAPTMKKVGENELRPGVMHRLDKDVSGVMILAKTQKAYEHLKAQFAGREAEKHYVALAYGLVPKDHEFITFKVARSKNRGRMVARPDGQDGKEAITEYNVLERLRTCTLLDVRTHTGRTHQIRTHLFAINHPLVGDTLYRKSDGGGMRHIRAVNIGRVFLHASSLSVERLDGTRQTFTAPLPEDLQEMLKNLPRK